MKLSALDAAKLLDAAAEARRAAYAPYSGYAVGAALLCGGGRVVTACNVENASYSLTSCAERNAIFAAVGSGERDFTAMAVVGGDAGGEPRSECLPCGACRQVLAEFCGEDFIVLTGTPEDVRSYTLSRLLPDSWSLPRS